MRRARILFTIMTAALCWAFTGMETARADKPKFRRVAEFEAKGDAKEVTAVQEAHYCTSRRRTYHDHWDVKRVYVV